MIRIIINADDFGINDIVTQEIERLIVAKLVSSTTIMANGKSLNEVADFTIHHPEISFGVHLCLDEYESLTKSRVLIENGVVDNNGLFIKGGIFSIKHFDDKLKKAIYDELCAQIEIVRSLGITISHADSHHLAHTRIKELQPLFIKLFKQYGIKKTRISEVYSIIDMVKNQIGYLDNKHVVHNEADKKDAIKSVSSSKLSKAYHLIETIWNQKLINDKYKNFFKTPDFFFFYSGMLDIVESSKRSFTDSVVELMCHPGHPSSVYQEEIRNIKNEALRDFIDYRLVSYNDL